MILMLELLAEWLQLTERTYNTDERRNFTNYLVLVYAQNNMAAGSKH